MIKHTLAPGFDGFEFEHMQECRELRRQIELDGLPDDPEDVRCQFVRMVENAEGLRVLFGGKHDARAIKEAHDLARIIREADAARMGATHVGTTTRH